MHICGLVRVCHLWCSQSGNLPDGSGVQQGRRPLRYKGFSAKYIYPSKNWLPNSGEKEKCGQTANQTQAGCSTGVTLPALLLKVCAVGKKQDFSFRHFEKQNQVGKAPPFNPKDWFSSNTRLGCFPSWNMSEGHLL